MAKAKNCRGLDRRARHFPSTFARPFPPRLEQTRFENRNSGARGNRARKLEAEVERKAVFLQVVYQRDKQKSVFALPKQRPAPLFLVTNRSIFHVAKPLQVVKDDPRNDPAQKVHHQVNIP